MNAGFRQAEFLFGKHRLWERHVFVDQILHARHEDRLHVRRRLEDLQQRLEDLGLEDLQGRLGGRAEFEEGMRGVDEWPELDKLR